MARQLEKRQSREIGDIVTADPGIMGGRRVFRGTRVPIEVLFENLADGLAIDDVLREHPTLDRDDVTALLRQTPSVLEASVNGVRTSRGLGAFIGSLHRPGSPALTLDEIDEAIRDGWAGKR